MGNERSVVTVAWMGVTVAEVIVQRGAPRVDLEEALCASWESAGLAIEVYDAVGDGSRGMPMRRGAPGIVVLF